MKAEVQFSVRARNFSLLNSVHTGSGVSKLSIRNLQGSLFPGVKRSVREAAHSPPSNAEVKKGGAITLVSHKRRTYVTLYWPRP
jgi:hypothetical protein